MTQIRQDNDYIVVNFIFILLSSVRVKLGQYVRNACVNEVQGKPI